MNSGRVLADGYIILISTTLLSCGFILDFTRTQMASFNTQVLYPVSIGFLTMLFVRQSLILWNLSRKGVEFTGPFYTFHSFFLVMIGLYLLFCNLIIQPNGMVGNYPHFFTIGILRVKPSYSIEEGGIAEELNLGKSIIMNIPDIEKISSIVSSKVVRQPFFNVTDELKVD